MLTLIEGIDIFPVQWHAFLWHISSSTLMKSLFCLINPYNKQVSNPKFCFPFNVQLLTFLPKSLGFHHWFLLLSFKSDLFHEHFGIIKGLERTQNAEFPDQLSLDTTCKGFTACVPSSCGSPEPWSLQSPARPNTDET